MNRAYGAATIICTGFICLLLGVKTKRSKEHRYNLQMLQPLQGKFDSSDSGQQMLLYSPLSNQQNQPLSNVEITWNNSMMSLGQKARRDLSDDTSGNRENGSPFIALTTQGTWCTSLSCPATGEPEIITLKSGLPLHWKFGNRTGSGDVVIIHGVEQGLLPTAISEFDMVTGRPFTFLSNDENNSEINAFRPASHIVLARCLWPVNSFPGKPGPFQCNASNHSNLRDQAEGSGPCLYSQDFFKPYKF